MPIIHKQKFSYYFEDFNSCLSEPSNGIYGPNVGVDGKNLTIMFLSLNRSELSIRLLKSIVDNLPKFAGKILIVDNGSVAEEINKVEEYCKEIPIPWKIIFLDKNYGVAGGRNRGFQEIDTDWALCLDNDIYFIDNPIPRVQKDLFETGTHFLSLPLLNPDLKTVYAFGGNLTIGLESNRVKLSLASVAQTGTSVTELDSTGDRPFLCTFLYGGASLINRHSFTLLGGYDEGMLIGFEDIDFSLRAFRAGYKVGSSSARALVHDHAVAYQSADVDYEKTRFSRQILAESARYLEYKSGYKIWADEVDNWLRDNEIKQGWKSLGDRFSIDSDSTDPRLLKKDRPVIALVTDTDNWAFSNIVRQIVRHLGDKYDFRVFPLVQLGEIQHAQWLATNCNGFFPEGGASALGMALVATANADIVHFFWREYLSLINSSVLSDYANSLGYTYANFAERFINGRWFSTSVYDHLFLDEEAIRFRQDIFNRYTRAYYVSSEKLNKIYSGIPDYPPPSEIIEDGVDLALFRPANLARFDNVSDRKIRIGWVGNSTWAGGENDFKGVNTLLVPVVEELISEGYPLQLHLADRQKNLIPHMEMPKYYSEIDLYICTSSIEGTPNPVLEAMGCGVPVISTDVGIVPQVFGELQKSFILKERSPECLKETIVSLLQDPEKFKLLSRENLQSIQAWSWTRQIEKFDSYFENLLYRKKIAEGENRTKICMLPFSNPSMETTGNIRLCSAASTFEYRDETAMGDCRSNGLAKVWSGDKYQDIRKALFTGENLPPFCDKCEYRYDGPVWLFQLHLCLHAYHNDVKSEKITLFIDRHRCRYDQYAEKAPELGLNVIPLPPRSQQPDIDQSDTGIPHELLVCDRMPIYLDLNTINRCNVSCIMCPFAIKYDDFGHSKDKFYCLTLDEYKTLVAGLNIQCSHFVGAYAEPLLNKEIFDLVAYAHSMGTFTAITTNGMLLSREVSSKLIEAGLDMLTISLHGSSKVVAEAVMRKSDFGSILNNIKILQEVKAELNVCKPELYFNYVGQKQNFKELPEFIDLAADLGVTFVNFIHLIDGDEVVDKFSNLVNYPDELTFVIKKAKQRATSRNINLIVSPAYEEAIKKHEGECSSSNQNL